MPRAPSTFPVVLPDNRHTATDEPDLSRPSLMYWVEGVAAVSGYDDAAWGAVALLEQGAKTLKLSVLSHPMQHDEQILPGKTPHVRQRITVDSVRRHLMNSPQGIRWPDFMGLFPASTLERTRSRARVCLHKLTSVGAAVKRYDLTDGGLRIFFTAHAPVLPGVGTGGAAPPTLQLTPQMLEAGLQVLLHAARRSKRASPELAAAVFTVMRALEPDPID